MLVLVLTLSIASFFLGSIPSGYIIGRARGVDIREIGSGNIGATNTRRALGNKAGAATLVLDALKGALAAAIPLLFDTGDTPGAWLGLCAVYGHCFSPFLSGRGGKGVATSLGVLIVQSPLLALATIVIFSVVARFSGISSVGSLSSAALLPVIAWLIHADSHETLTLAAALSAVVIIQHRENIVRLISGTESSSSELEIGQST